MHAPPDRKTSRLEPEIELDSLAEQVVDGAYQVYTHLGPGLLESIYRRALSYELQSRKLLVEEEVPIDLCYKGLNLPQALRLDLRVGGRLIVELKSANGSPEVHLAQLLSYLRLTRQPLGLLINFKMPSFQGVVRRVVNSKL